MVASLCTLLLLLVRCRADLWERDVGSEIEIGPSASGWTSVQLTCRSDLLRVTVHFPEAFSGVVYTRGNYGEDSPCMADPDEETSVSMQLPNSVCNVAQDDEWRNTTLVLQHDDFLIFEGDTAFGLSCRVDGDHYEASVAIASPDPGSLPLPPERSSQLTGSGSVTFRPADVRPESLTGSRGPGQINIDSSELKSEPRESMVPKSARASVDRVEL